MLTFFDYLRRRAFESVLCGAHEALELLESHQDHREPKQPESKLPAPAADAQAEGSAKKSGNDTAGASAAGDELLPAPRRRGRPDMKSKGER